MENIKINSLEELEAGSADIDSTKTYSNKDLFKPLHKDFNNLIASEKNLELQKQKWRFSIYR